MTDRELLELAAKAAGGFCSKGVAVNLAVGRTWNPLTDDGDALRLAVQLWFNIKLFNPCDPIGDDDVMSHGMVEVWREDDDDPLAVEYFKNANLRHKATRRAIVSAAAEIGKDIP